jgi:hypothetical protein
MFLDTQAS